MGDEQLRAGAVSEDELSKASVITRKLANGSVTNRKIGPGALTGSRFAPDTLTGAEIDEGTLGAVPLAADAERAKIAARAQSADRVEHATLADRATRADVAQLATVANGLGNVDRVVVDAPLPESSRDAFVVVCAPDHVVVGGGYIQADDFDDVVYLSSSGPVAADRWAVAVIDEPTIDTGQDTPGLAYALCVKADSN